MIVNKGQWIEIESLILKAEERSPNLPIETKETDLKMWIRGFLVDNSAMLGDEVVIETLSKRLVKGTFVEMRPRHNYDFGDTIIELIQIGEELKESFSQLLGGE